MITLEYKDNKDFSKTIFNKETGEPIDGIRNIDFIPPDLGSYHNLTEIIVTIRFWQTFENLAEEALAAYEKEYKTELHEGVKKIFIDGYKAGKAAK